MTIEAVAVPAGRGGLALAWRRLRRNPAAIVSAATLIVIVLACFPGAPLWVDVACHHGPNDQNIEGFIHQGGHRIPVVRADGTPSGPAGARATCSVPTPTGATSRCASSTEAGSRSRWAPPRHSCASRWRS